MYGIQIPPATINTKSIAFNDYREFDAPIDDKTYGRKNNKWNDIDSLIDSKIGELDSKFNSLERRVEETIDNEIAVIENELSGKVEEAPNDGKAYWRKNKNWEQTNIEEELKKHRHIAHVNENVDQPISIRYGTEPLVSGESFLASNTIYIQYEA